MGIGKVGIDEVGINRGNKPLVFRSSAKDPVVKVSD